MALTNIVRRAASRVAPLAARALGGESCFYHQHCSAVGGGVSRKIQLFRSSVPSALQQHYSTKSDESDESLLQVIESEIQCTKQIYNCDEAVAIPSSFPFKLEDNPGHQTVTLTRDYQGENIVVVVHMTTPFTGKSDEDNDNYNDGDTDSAIPLVVRLSKNIGPCLEFGVIVYSDEISIKSLSNLLTQRIKFHTKDLISGIWVTICRRLSTSTWR